MIYTSPKPKIVLMKDTRMLEKCSKIEIKDMQNMTHICKSLQIRKTCMHHTFYVRKRGQEENMVQVYPKQSC